MSYNPTILFQKLSADINTANNTLSSANTPIRTLFFSGQLLRTPKNVEQVTEVEKLVSLFRHQTLNFLKFTLLHKTMKAARLAIADRVILNHTNTKPLAINIPKKQQVQRTCVQYNSQGARVLSLEDVEKRK